tara:strand:- start:932 stop:1177 length:246 start_codon:yes stop_codon:yes gene_type:complete
LDYPDRRQRLHQILIALIHQQNNLELMDEDVSILNNSDSNYLDKDPASWLNRNRRILKKYQALVNSARALEALIDDDRDGP